MVFIPAAMSGSEEDKAPGEQGLDARLDRVVPNEVAMGFLLAGDGSQPGRVYPLTRNTSIVGRAETADVRVPQAAVSNEHARIINGAAGFEVEDLGSVNGTFVNGERITKRTLKRGDRIGFGNIEFTFLMERTPDATMALLPPRRRPAAVTDFRPVEVARHHQRQLGDRGRDRDRDDDGEGGGLTDAVRKAVTGYRTLRPYFNTALLLAGVGMAAGTASVFALPPPKQAICETKLQPAKKANPMDGGERAHPDETLQFFVDSERTFVAPALVRDSLQKLHGKDFEKNFDESLVGQIAPRLRLEPAGERLYRATYKEPLLGAGVVEPVALLDAHVKNYIQTDIERGLKALDGETKFINDKLAVAAADLTRINQELAEFKRVNSDDLPETSTQAHSSKYYLDTRRGELTAQIAKLAGELAVDEGQLKDGNPLNQSKFQASQAYRATLQDLKKKRNEAYARGLADGHPDLQQINNEIVRLEKVIEQEMVAETSVVDRTSDPALAALRAKVGMQRAQLRAAQIEMQEVKQNLGRVKDTVGAMPGVAARLDDLQRQYDAKKRLYDQLSDHAQKASLQLEVERIAAQSRFEIVTPTFLLEPKLSQSLAVRGGIGLMLGLLLASLFVAFREGKKFVVRTMASIDDRG